MARGVKTGPASKRGTNDIDVFIGARVRARRQLLGITQQEFGARLGVSFQQVQKYEKGTNRMGASRLVEIAAALEVPVGWLFEGAPGVGKSGKPLSGGRHDEISTFMSDPLGVRLMGSFPALGERVKRAIVGLVETQAAG